MPTKAGQIIIDVQAGTSKFVVDMEKANAKIRELGTSSAGAVGELKATTATMKTLEGGLTNNNRAATAFLVNILKLGPAMQVAFPVIGAIAFAGVIGEVGKKVYDFFKQLSEAPAKTKSAWSELTSSIQLSNAQLELSNAQLEQEIAKLEGKHQNNLAINLLEAKVAAEQLGETLEKDIQSMYKLFKEEDAGLIGRMFGGASTAALQKVSQQAARDVQKANLVQDERLSSIDPKDKNAKRDRQQIIEDTQSDYNDAFKKITDQLRKDLSDAELAAKPAADLGGHFGDVGYRIPGSVDEDAVKQVENLKIQLMQVDGLYRKISDTNKHMGLSETVRDKKTDKENAKPDDDPAGDALKKLHAQVKAVNTELASVGKGHEAQLIAKAFATAGEKVEELNNQIVKLNEKLPKGKQIKPVSDVQKADFQQSEKDLAQGKDQVEFGNRIAETIAKLKEETAAQNTLSATIGEGYEAVKKAAIEVMTIKEFGSRINENEDETERYRAAQEAKYDSEHAAQIKTTIAGLERQTAFEKELANAEALGAGAVRKVTLEYAIQEAQLHANVSQWEAIRKAMTDASDSKLATDLSKETAQLKLKTEAMERLAKAVGILAKEESELENVRREAIAQNKNPDEAVDAAQRRIRADVSNKAGTLASQYSDKSIEIAREKVALNDKLANGEITQEQYAAARLSLDKQQLEVMIQQEEASGTIKGSIDATFDKMKLDSKEIGKGAW